MVASDMLLPEDPPFDVDFQIAADLCYPSDALDYVLPSDLQADGTTELPESSCDPMSSSANHFGEPTEDILSAAIAKRWFSELDFEHADDSRTGTDTTFAALSATEQNQPPEPYGLSPTCRLGWQWSQEPLPSTEFLVSYYPGSATLPLKDRPWIESFPSLGLADRFVLTCLTGAVYSELFRLFQPGVPSSP